MGSAKPNCLPGGIGSWKVDRRRSGLAEDRANSTGIARYGSWNARWAS
ncbi:hypothetical protein MNV_2170001 [Candidatus Methanoperedens nitroreducens]|uniref:Uncharacterized protein n=1 Tax=Candidatus Methanoperedens nitratireducens TaxID=1392998 RepID=A0A284VNV9_9EURY|nr:hypothetical protein MNV_2170001 [Candidatus Methanoperedens nitroreducens]